MMMVMNVEVSLMPDPKIPGLTAERVIQAAKILGPTRPAKWTVRVDGIEYAARPLILAAADRLPNDPINSHQAIAILKKLGFKTFYDGRAA